MHSFLSLTFFFLACEKPLEFRSPDVIVLDWQEGQTFHLAASRRHIAHMTEESPVGLHPYLEEQALIETWSPETIWSYRVVEDKLLPTDERMREFSISAAGQPVELTVIKSFIDPSINMGSTLLELNPITYFVFRSDNNRLVALIQFTTVQGIQKQEVYYVKHGNHSSSVLSQSTLTLTPTYLAPFGSRWYSSTLPTETGNYVYSQWVDQNVVDVTFSDEISDELITTRYERDYPWPIQTVSENFRSHLLTEEELQDIRGSLPEEEPNDLDFRAALSDPQAIDMSETIRIDPTWVDYLDDDYESEDYANWEVDFEHYPWAGNWWSRRKGELVFGRSTSQTFSDQLKETVDVHKDILDQLSLEIRTLQKEPQTASTQEQLSLKIENYRDTQKVLTEEIIQFYDGLYADLQSGNTDIQDKALRNVSGQNYDIDQLSPLDKLALVDYITGATEYNPFYLSGWEILNGYNPNGEAWWGNSHGCAAASILANQPTEDIVYSANTQDMRFTTMDLKALLTANHSSTHAYYYGERFRKTDDDERDLSPESFHKLLTHYLRQKKMPLIVDIEKRQAVWNHPIAEARLKIKFIKQNLVEGTVNVTTTTVEEMITYGIPEAYARDIITYREAIGIITDISEFQQLEHYDEAYNMFFRLENRRITYQIRVEALLSNCQNVDIINPVEVNNHSYLSMYWRYFLTVNEDGLIIAGSWKHPTGLLSEDELYSELDEEVTHPDFAWVPYHNPRGTSSQEAENPYLNYGRFLELFGDDFER